jgi:CBS domain-containing protein
MALVARDIMNTDVISVPMSMDLRDLARLFLDKGITGAPVVDDRGNLAGVISQTDLIFYSLTRDDELKSDSAFYQTARVEGQHVPRGFQIEDCNTAFVADVMTPLVHAVTERSTVEAVSRLMTRKHIHRVIVRRGRKVAGIISALDVLKAQDDGARAAARHRRDGVRPKPARARRAAVAR